QLLPQPRYAQILTTDSAQQHPIEGPRGSETNHGMHRHTQKREFGSALPFCAARGLSRQVITTESTKGHRNGNTLGSPFRVVPCFPWLRIFLRLGRASEPMVQAHPDVPAEEDREPKKSPNKANLESTQASSPQKVESGFTGPAGRKQSHL